ncbi:MAG: hypothetical protein GTO16_02660, partial [Candidatus Aminicenantes bacterium]|nr:hypothetical protein [Candidatus Aminicenantes bacterium]
MQKEEMRARMLLLKALKNVERLKEAEIDSNRLCLQEDVKRGKLTRRKSMRTIEYAKSYVKQGFSVIPLRPRDKRP